MRRFDRGSYQGAHFRANTAFFGPEAIVWNRGRPGEAFVDTL
jgi:hypothetical protein